MIDAPYQNKGIGNVAFKKLLQKIIHTENPDKIELVKIL